MGGGGVDVDALSLFFLLSVVTGWGVGLYAMITLGTGDSVSSCACMTWMYVRLGLGGGMGSRCALAGRRCWYRFMSSV